jgi:hypothetical protein
MILTSSTVEVNAEPGDLWQYVTNWSNHARWIPFTSIESSSNNENMDSVGFKFVGITKFGFIRLVDEMIVVKSNRPIFEKVELGLSLKEQPTLVVENGFLTVEKVGYPLKGGAGFTIQPILRDGKLISRLTWFERIVNPYSKLRFLDAPISFFADLVFASVLIRIKRDAELAFA